MIGWFRKRSLPTRVLIYAAAALLAFAVAAGVGATTALMIRGDLSLPSRKDPQPAGEQGDAPQRQGADPGQSQQKEAGAEQAEAASQQERAEYVGKVDEIQANSTETFFDSHDKLLRYDALNADDVEQMQANQITLQETTEQVANLDPPQRYREQYEVFRSAINELHQAAQLAYNLAADPVSATQSDIDEYERHVNEAAAGLERSNEILGRDYKTIEGVQKVNPLS
jgi:hypothetical protein